jgi:hypothetical protein
MAIVRLDVKIIVQLIRSNMYWFVRRSLFMLTKYSLNVQ